MNVPAPAERPAARIAVDVCAAAAPALIVIALVAVRFGAGPTEFVPRWNDEVVYWNETAAFARAGFDAGYVAVNEQVAPAAFSRFGPHGPVFAVLSGLVARATGWQPHSGFLVNLLLVSAAALAWLRVRRPATWPELALPAIFWPLLLLLPTNMQEPMHFAVAFLLAAATWRLLDGGPAARTWVWAAPVLAVASLARPTWALMLLPLGWAQAGSTRVRTRVLLAAAAVAAMAIAQQTFAYVSAPFPGSVAYVSTSGAASLSDLATAPLRGVGIALSRVPATMAAYLDPGNGDPSEVALRYTGLALSLVLMVPALVARDPSKRRNALAAQAAALALILPLGLVIGTGYIEGFRDFRIVAPHLLYSVLVAAAATPLVRAAWWLTLLGGSIYVQTFADLHRDRFVVDRARIDGVRAALAPVLFHDPAGAGWGNTVLVHVDLLEYPLLGLPHGLSVSYALDWDDQAVPLRSRYVLLRPADEEALTGRQVRLRPLAVTPIGTLYRNLDAT